MKTYQLRFSSISPITKIPDSQSFFGALAHAIKSRFGKEQLEELLLKGMKKEFPFIVSSFFFTKTLPLPLDITPTFLSESNISINQLKAIKKTKKIKSISLGIYQDYASNLDQFNTSFYHKLFSNEYLLIQDDSLLIKNDEVNLFSQAKPYKTTTRVRNKVNISEETDLFYNQVIYLKDDQKFDVYLKVHSNDILNIIIESLQKQVYISIGGKRSIGLNLFKYLDCQEVNFPENHQKKMLLSKSIIDSDQVDWEHSYYKNVVLNNKFDLIKEKVFKKQLLCFVEGSVFTTNQNFIGSYVPEEKQPFTVYHNAVGFMI
ncbi:MAG: hypothetical protein BWY97_01299 [Tenericutes bacterium ADurb.BinA124]|nr:MAG: hypothetical protein BWY97_01299 [Tenericutes bacterium ADurb.BinA124]